jgi:hypothetical protein
MFLCTQSTSHSPIHERTRRLRSAARRILVIATVLHLYFWVIWLAQGRLGNIWPPQVPLWILIASAQFLSTAAFIGLAVYVRFWNPFVKRLAVLWIILLILEAMAHLTLRILRDYADRTYRGTGIVWEAMTQPVIPKWVRFIEWPFGYGETVAASISLATAIVGLMVLWKCRGILNRAFHMG